MGCGHVLVVGSLNLDRTVFVDQLPLPGETIIVREFFSAPGGKSANQAVAAARCGARVRFVGAVGADDTGRAAVGELARAGVEVDWVIEADGQPTGTAYVTVDAHGENTIAVAAGANGVLGPDALNCEQFDGAAALLLALEVPDAVLLAAAATARQKSIPIIVNVSPLRLFDHALLAAADILIVNASEFAALRAETPLDVPVVLVTRGGDGVDIVEAALRERVSHVPSVPITAVDTTGCGDAFAGALAARLAARDCLVGAVEFAAGYAALVATRRGAQISYPAAAEYEAWRAKASRS